MEDSRGSEFLKKRFNEREITDKQEKFLPTHSLLDVSRTPTLLKFKTEFTFEAVFFMLIIGVPVGNVPWSIVGDVPCYEVADVQKSMVADVP